ncbi:MAG: T9SS C-terminal target domain-containing protein [Calditrichaeota bacterium]|nr:MAG: T9SS C-terminal target domain-containing protein [Calditrichota bacterium]
MESLTKFVGIILLFSFSLAAEVSIKITEPVNRQVVDPCSDLTVKFEYTATAGEQVKHIQLLSNGVVKARVRTEPWQYVWKKIPKGNYELTARFVTQDDVEYYSSPIRISAGLVEPGERLYNGGFDCGVITPWRPSTNGGGQATFTVYEDIYFDDPYYLGVEIDMVSADAWCVQMLQLCPLDSGHTYQVSFLADAIVKKNIYVGMQEAQDPWTSQFGATVEIDGADLYGPFEFVANRTDPTNDMVFHFGGDDTPVFLDDVRVIDKSITSVKSKDLDFPQGIISEYELFQAFPNPFNLNSTIPFRLSQSAEIALTIYSMTGQKVRTLYQGRQTEGLHSLTWNGADDLERIVPSGVYVYQLSVDDGTHQQELSRKVLLLK